MAAVRAADAGEVPALSAALAEAFVADAVVNWMLPQRIRRVARRELMFTLEQWRWPTTMEGRTALIRSTLERCDSDGLPAYIEASSERSAALYGRLGFVHLGVLQLPDGGPPVWPMRRPSRD